MNIEFKFEKAVEWTKNYANENNIKFLVIPFTDNATSTLLLKIASKTNIDFEPIILPNENYPLNKAFGQAITALTNCNELIDLYTEAIRLADKRDGIVLGNISKHQIFTRHYKKYGEANADIFPIIDIFYDEAIELTKTIYNDCLDKSILGLNYNEIKWATKENDKYNIITREEKPNTFDKWYKYTKRQKEVISYIYQREKLTRHKKIVRSSCIFE